MKNRFLTLGIITLFTALVIMSCSKDDVNYDLLTENTENYQLNKESLEFKHSIISTFETQNASTKSGVNTNSNFAEDQIEDLREKSIDMFKSHGFEQSELDDLLEDGDERIIFMATVFTAIIDQEPIYSTPGVIKTKLESSSVDDDTCYPSASVSDCLLRATGIKEILTGCLTKYAAFKILGRLVPYAGYTVAAADFANCMGWLNWW